MEKDIKLIEELSTAFGPSGLEDKVVDIVKNQIADFMDFKENTMRCLFANFKNKNIGGKKVMLDAHLDEIGIMVQAIRPNGTIEFLTLGSFVLSSLPNSHIQILNDDNELIDGVVSTIPPHYSSNNNLDVTQMTIDVGATSSKEVKEIFKISVGNFGVPYTKFKFDQKNDLIFGKAFDDRIGVAATIKCLKALKDEKLNVDVIASFTSQEEIGDRGAYTALTLNPDIAICFEGCPADDTFQAEYKIQSGIKRGPMIRHLDKSIIASPRLMRFAKDIAKKYNIPLQEAVRSGGGNNGAIYVRGNNGIPTIVIGIPVRYIHTSTGITSYTDYENAVKLALEIIKNLNTEIIQSM